MGVASTLFSLRTRVYKASPSARKLLWGERRGRPTQAELELRHLLSLLLLTATQETCHLRRAPARGPRLLQQVNLLPSSSRPSSPERFDTSQVLPPESRT